MDINPLLKQAPVICTIIDLASDGHLGRVLIFRITNKYFKKFVEEKYLPFKWSAAQKEINHLQEIEKKNPNSSALEKFKILSAQLYLFPRSMCIHLKNINVALENFEQENQALKLIWKKKLWVIVTGYRNDYPPEPIPSQTASIKEITDFIFKSEMLKKISYFHLSDLGIKAIPRQLGYLKVQLLELNNNQIEEIPDRFYVENAHCVSLNNNKLSKFTKNLRGPNLHLINFKANPIPTTGLPSSDMKAHQPGVIVVVLNDRQIYFNKDNW